MFLNSHPPPIWLFVPLLRMCSMIVVMWTSTGRSSITLSRAYSMVVVVWVWSLVFYRNLYGGSHGQNVSLYFTGTILQATSQGDSMASFTLSYFTGIVKENVLNTVTQLPIFTLKSSQNRPILGTFLQTWCLSHVWDKNRLRSQIWDTLYFTGSLRRSIWWVLLSPYFTGNVTGDPHVTPTFYMDRYRGLYRQARIVSEQPHFEAFSSDMMSDIWEKLSQKSNMRHSLYFTGIFCRAWVLPFYKTPIPISRNSLSCKDLGALTIS